MLTLISEHFPLVGRVLTPIGERFPLVGYPVPLVSHPVPPVGDLHLRLNKQPGVISRAGRGFDGQLLPAPTLEYGVMFRRVATAVILGV